MLLWNSSNLISSSCINTIFGHILVYLIPMYSTNKMFYISELDKWSAMIVDLQRKLKISCTPNKCTLHKKYWIYIKRKVKLIEFVKNSGTWLKIFIQIQIFPNEDQQQNQPNQYYAYLDRIYLIDIFPFIVRLRKIKKSYVRGKW